MFTTERTRLRAYKDSDLPILVALYNDPLVQNTITPEPVVPRGPRITAKMEEVANAALMYVVIEATDRNNEIIGVASLAQESSPKNRDASLGLGLIPAVWNKGYGAEICRFLVDYAFKNLGVHRVSLSVYENNKGAIRLYHKIGFVDEGRKRKQNWINGEWHDTLLMSIIDEEWFAMERETPKV